uniref:Ig-like domain-containing protein n=1 Tax=Lepisosteus oculatus TaxID=7918 RepID=W5MPB5_LEPOC
RMSSLGLLLCTLLLLAQESCSQIVMTQSPTVRSNLQGERVTLSCKSSQQVYHLSWYHQRTGEAPRLLIHTKDTRASGIPDRFTGSYSGGSSSGYGTDFTLTITGVQAEDAGDYYCLQYDSLPLTQ